MKMKASWYEKLGPANEVLLNGEMAIPEVGDDDVLVSLYSSGINPSDAKRRSGLRNEMPFARIIPHSDGAGIIERVGCNVSQHRIGQRVWLYNACWGRPFGTAAEYIVIPETFAVPLPNTTSFEAGACLGIPAMTAQRCVFSNGSVENKIVLVTGGAGSVGYYAIQFAKWGGAKVITTVSTPEKAEYAKKAGADYILNYREDNLVTEINTITKNQGVDLIVEVDFGTNLATNQEIIKSNGCIASYASEGNPNPQIPFYPLMFKNILLQLVFVYELSETARAAAIHDISSMLNSNSLTHLIAAKFPLEEIVAAHQLIESNKVIGNVILDINI